MTFYDYRWAAGHGVVLASLVNVETDLYPYTKPRQIAPTSQPLELFPVRAITLDGAERGEGTLTHAWTFKALPWSAYTHILDTYFTVSGMVVASRAMTIYTRDPKMGYARYNAYALLPKQGDQLRFRQSLALDLVIRFSGLVKLA